MEVEGIIISLKTKSLALWDNINAKTLKCLKRCIVSPTTDLFNRCLNNEVFSKSLKKSIVDPIHKDDNRDCVNKYRPISFNPTPLKILEKNINSTLVNDLKG